MVSVARPSTGAPPRSRRRWIPIVAGVALVVLAGAVAVALLRGSGGKTFSAHGITFRYPSGWEPVPGATFTTAGNELTRDILGVDARNAVLIATYRLNLAVTAASFRQVRGEIVGSITQIVRDAGGRLDGGPTEVTVGGMPALRFDESVAGPPPLRSRLVAAFRGTIEYWINCRYDPAHASEFEAACDRIAATFRAT